MRGMSASAVWIRLGVLVVVATVGLALNQLLQAHLATLQLVAQSDPLGARAQFANELRIGGLALFAVTALLGASVIASARRAARDLRFPPAGIWSWGTSRTVTGPAVRQFA